VATFLAKGFFATRPVRKLFLFVDGFAVAMFAIQATSTVWDLGFGLPLAPVILGVITAIGGGLTRDVLVQQQTLLMSRELYAIPVVFGCTLYTLILAFAPEYRLAGAFVCMFVIFAIRAAAIQWDIVVPEWATTGYGWGSQRDD
jgi:uncharacterized membrane protein YeiH